MRSHISRPHFVLGPARPQSSSLTAWLQLSVAAHLQRHARPEVVWMAMPGGAGHDLPDLMFVIPGRQACFMCFAAPETVQDPACSALQQRLEAAGAGYALIRDEAAALQALKEWKVLKSIPEPSGRPIGAGMPMPPEDVHQPKEYEEMPPMSSARKHEIPPVSAAAPGSDHSPPDLSRLLSITAIAAQTAGSSMTGAGGRW